jgi:uncharacterized protein (DUF58 family)
VAGYRPGPHAGTALGSGHEFASHARLFDKPDPRRIDIRASLRTVPREWQVKVYRQRSSIPVYAVVDISGSMHFGSPHTKLEVVGDLVESLGYSTFRAGDPAGLLTFSEALLPDLYVPARHSRGIGTLMADALRACAHRRGPLARRRETGLALYETAQKLAGKRALVFLVSDFHWDMKQLAASLDAMSDASIVPIVVWDPAEATAPDGQGLLKVRDMEAGESRSMWMNPTLRERWRAAVAARRKALNGLFASRGMRPFYLQSAFDPELLSRYFFEDYA